METTFAIKTHILKFYEGRKGNIVAKMPDGKLALADNKNPLSNAIQKGEQWEVQEKFDKTACVIVTPLKKIA
jgi:hypothetical protein